MGENEKPTQTTRRAEQYRVFGRFLAPLVLECFCAANLLFLGADIYLAHSANEFAHTTEWIPVYFGIGAGLLLLPGLFSFRGKVSAWMSLGVGWSSVLVGVIGTVLHLESTFFAQQTLHNLVYTAPFAAPMSFIGVGLLLILNRMEAGIAWARWVLFLTGGSFVGLFALALADHAQNGFFHPTEWIGVISAAYGTTFVFGAAIVGADSKLLRATLFLLLVQFVVGVLGFGLHLLANLESSAPTWWDRFVFGAPVFAPLLYPNMAFLGALGCAALLHEQKSTADPDPSA